jgi:hypothetical protein
MERLRRFYPHCPGPVQTAQNRPFPAPQLAALLVCCKSLMQNEAMKKLRTRPVFRNITKEEFRAPACEICGAPYKLLQALNLRTPKGQPPFGSYVQTCKCERPAPPKRDYGADVPF